MTRSSVPDVVRSISSDYAAALARGVAGLVPVVGPVLAEMIGMTIPRQRIDRVAKLALELDRRMQEVEECLMAAKLNDEEFIDLIEEGVRQATRSLSDERRAYIANIIVNSLASDDIEHNESKHLLRILDEINDIEVIWLCSYGERSWGKAKAFHETHEKILTPVVATMGASDEVRNKAILQESYKEHLSQLGLLEKQYRIDHETNMPEFDQFTGSMKDEGFELTALGSLLLNEIGLGKENRIS